MQRRTVPRRTAPVAGCLLGLTCLGMGGLMLAGCGGGGGGGNGPSDISTGASGRLQNVQIGPRAGSAFVSPATTFQLSWTAAAPPPATFGVLLRRYLEPRGGESKDTSTQNIFVSRQGPGFVYNVGRKDGFHLDTGGVYYLDLHSGAGDTQQAAFIADGGPTVAGNQSTQTVSPGMGGSLSGLTIVPAPGSVNIPKNTAFVLSWAGPTPPPSQFTVALHRYKEARGTDTGGNEEQNITVSGQGVNVWRVRRKDDYDLESDGTYYLEVSAPGQDPVRAVYITSS